MLQDAYLPFLHTHKNLLAFSGGSDSTALFFLLLEHNIDFDIALVNYQTRDESDQEAEYAQELATTYHKKCYIKTVQLSDTNFEHQAREARYDFFQTLVAQHHYSVIMTAHHLGDRLEWFLMQLSKGAGLPELLGMQVVTYKTDYILFRPLLQTSKNEILDYLKTSQHHYFNDSSNDDEDFKRNHFRHHYANPLLETYASGIKNSFEFLDKDCALFIESSTYKQCNALYYFKHHHTKRSSLILIDKILKHKNYVMSRAEKEYLLENDAHIVGRTYVVVFESDYVFVAPYEHDIVMEKSHKEACRKLGIHKTLRPYLFSDSEAFALVHTLLTQEVSISRH